MNNQNCKQSNCSGTFMAHYLYNERDLVSVMDQGIPPIDYEQKALSVDGCVLADQEQIEQESKDQNNPQRFDPRKKHFKGNFCQP